MNATDESPQGYWLGVHWLWLAVGFTLGLISASIVTHALYTVNLMCIEYPNLFRSLIFAPSFAGLGGLVAGSSIMAFWWTMGFVYETHKLMRAVTYEDDDVDDDNTD